MSKIIEAETARLAGLQIDALQKIRTGQFTLDQLEWWLNLATNQRDQIMAPASPILARLYEDEKILVGATEGTETLAGSGTVFTGYLDPDFKNWGTDQPSDATPEQEVCVHEMRKDARFAEIFTSLNFDLDKLCLTQNQIIKFCVKNRNKLRQDGYATFFLFKAKTEKGKEYFVAGVDVTGGRLEARVRRFEHVSVWCAVSRHRVVVPQLEDSAT